MAQTSAAMKTKRQLALLMLFLVGKPTRAPRKNCAQGN